MADHIITGIDVGTYQVKVVIARQLSPSSSRALPEIIGTGITESRGMRHGYVVSESDVIKSIRSAVTQAQKTAGVEVKRAYLSIGGIGLDEMHSYGEVITSRADSEITQIDIEKAMADSEERIQDKIPNRKILHAIPLSYSVDNEKVLGRPHGMKGTKLDVETLFITCLEQHINDLMSAIESTGIIVDDVMASPLAGSLALLTKAQRRAGCVLANIGAETVSIVVFENHTPISLKVFPVGSTDITNDIALGLKIPPEEAEKIKRGHGTALYPKRKLDDIVDSRLADIFELIGAHLKKIKRDGLLPAGIILTGGGAGGLSTQDLARATLHLPSRTAVIDGGKNSKVRDNSFAVAYGLCIWGLRGQEEDTGIRMARKTGNSILNWFKQFLP